jgi:hypothetical protein
LTPPPKGRSRSALPSRRRVARYYRRPYSPRVSHYKSGPSGPSRSNEERRADGSPIVKSFTLEQALAARLTAQADRHGLSQTQIVSDALRRYLPTLEGRSAQVSKP